MMSLLRNRPILLLSILASVFLCRAEKSSTIDESTSAAIRQLLSSYETNQLRTEHRSCYTMEEFRPPIQKDQLENTARFMVFQSSQTEEAIAAALITSATMLRHNFRHIGFSYTTQTEISEDSAMCFSIEELSTAPISHTFIKSSETSDGVPLCADIQWPLAVRLYKENGVVNADIHSFGYLSQTGYAWLKLYFDHGQASGQTLEVETDSTSISLRLKPGFTLSNTLGNAISLFINVSSSGQLREEISFRNGEVQESRQFLAYQTDSSSESPTATQITIRLGGGLFVRRFTKVDCYSDSYYMYGRYSEDLKIPPVETLQGLAQRGLTINPMPGASIPAGLVGYADQH